MRPSNLFHPLLAILLAGPLAGQSAAPCDATTPVEHVALNVVDFAEGYGHPLTVRVARPFTQERVAPWVEDEAIWLLPLRRAAAVSGIALELRPPGYLVRMTEPPRAVLREGECIGEFTFRPERAWQAAVSSDPVNLRVVAAVLANGAPADSFEGQTNFTTTFLPWGSELRLEIFGGGKHSFPVTITPEQLARAPDGKIPFDQKAIRDQICAAHVRVCNGWLSMLTKRIAVPNAVLIQLVKP